MALVHFTERQLTMYSQAIFDCLLQTEPLVRQLSGAEPFEQSLLAMPGEGKTLNFEQKLGHLFEDAFAAMVEASHGLTLIDRSVQIQGDDGRTLGEMDFIILDEDLQQHWHLELAIKFYLIRHDEDGTVRFPGPDARDNWPRKLRRMTSHQLQLRNQPGVREFLASEYGIDQLKVKHAVYGCLFDHIDAKSVTPAPSISDSCRRGRWLRVSELNKLDLVATGRCLTMLPKPLWPVEMIDSLRPVLPRVSMDHLIRCAEERGVMFVMPESRQPMFLVADLWPNHST